MPSILAFANFALNHLLEQQSWARLQLAPFVGRKVYLPMPPLAMVLTVQEGGRLAIDKMKGPIPFDVPPYDVSITLPSNAFLAVLTNRGTTIIKQAKIEGEAEFAAILANLAEYLRWEPEETLAQWMGDAAAHGFMRKARSSYQQLRHSGRDLLETAAEYLLDENPQLVRYATLNRFAADVAKLSDATARLEKRLRHLENKLKASAQIDPSFNRVS